MVLWRVARRLGSQAGPRLRPVAALQTHFSSESQPTISTDELSKLGYMSKPVSDGWTEYVPEDEQATRASGLFQSVDHNLEVRVRPWTPKSVRTGVLGRKMGQISVWDYWGVQTHLTVIEIDSQVIETKTELHPKKGTVNTRMGIGKKKLKRIHRVQMIDYMRQGIEPKVKVAEFQTTPDAVLPAGWRIDARHFKPGQFIDVTGTTIGKGFAGTMKRHGFAGQGASHGNSKAHRLLGSIASGSQDPGKVWPGTKMPGRMGGKRTTTANIQIYKVDVQRNLIFLKGAVPGYAGNYLLMRDALKKKFSEDDLPPFPTYIPQDGDKGELERVMEPSKDNPYAYGSV